MGGEYGLDQVRDSWPGGIGVRDTLPGALGWPVYKDYSHLTSCKHESQSSAMEVYNCSHKSYMISVTIPCDSCTHILTICIEMDGCCLYYTITDSEGNTDYPSPIIFL